MKNLADSPLFKAMTTHSVEERSASANLDVRLNQVSKGKFESRLSACVINDILIYRDVWSQLAVARGALKPGYIFLAAALDKNKKVDWCGASAGRHRLALGLPAKELEFVMPADTRYAAIIGKVSFFKSTLGSYVVDQLVRSGNCHIEAEYPRIETLLLRINSIIEHCQSGQNPTGKHTLQAIEMDLIDAISNLDTGSTLRAVNIKQAAQRRLLKQALDAGESLEESISVPQFAAQLATGQRSLELAFKRYLGVTPKQYLDRRRMHGVYHELHERPPESHCVAEVATKWGFYELGRFAGNYRRQFGELPSETLKKTAACSQNRLIDLIK